MQRACGGYLFLQGHKSGVAALILDNLQRARSRQCQHALHQLAQPLQSAAERKSNKITVPIRFSSLATKIEQEHKAGGANCPALSILRGDGMFMHICKVNGV